MSLKVAIIDSGVDVRLNAAVGGRVAFHADAEGLVQPMSPDVGDQLGHGTAVASLVLLYEPSCILLSAQVFHAPMPTSAAVVAAGVAWAVAEGARVINLSLGLQEDRRALRESCEKAIGQGALLIASCPARGGMTYPAAYPGVLAVHGDARCADGDVSCMATDVFGASPLPPVELTGGGASYSAARMAGMAAAFFTSCPVASAADFKNHLLANARFFGRERRQAAA